LLIVYMSIFLLVGILILYKIILISSIPVEYILIILIWNYVVGFVVAGLCWKYLGFPRITFIGKIFKRFMDVYYVD